MTDSAELEKPIPIREILDGAAGCLLFGVSLVLWIPVADLANAALSGEPIRGESGMPEDGHRVLALGLIFLFANIAWTVVTGTWCLIRWKPSWILLMPASAVVTLLVIARR